MTPEPPEALVERVRLGLRNGYRDLRLMPVADAALTELAERLRLAEANHPDAMAGIAALRGRLEAAEQDAETLSDLADALRAERDGLQEQVETLEKEIARLKTDRGMWHHEPIPASEGKLGTPTAKQSERTEPLPARES